MGASGWSYFVPYQANLDVALEQLREATFAGGDYLWPYEFYRSLGVDIDDKPRPSTMDELFEDEMIQEGGTHSILDMYKVVGPGEEPDFGTVQPVSAEEARTAAGTDVLTRSHVTDIDALAEQRWFGRCAVLHDADGRPSEIYFFGFSGD